MLRRVVPVLGVVALVTAACGAPDIVVRSEEPEGPTWFSLVADAEADAGTGLSLATDADGNPHLAYLSFEEEVEGEPPASDPLAPTLPAVMHAHLVGDVWTRGPVADDQDVDEDSETAIAVDAEGVHHVAWTAGGSILYSSNAEGEFAEEPEVVEDTEAVGLSIAADADGIPMIAFQTSEDVAEGPASLVRLATSDGEGAWTVETVAEASSPEDPAGTAVLLTSDGPVVAFGSDGETLVASQRGSRWVSETVDPDGGVGVAGATDADGNPHLAYLTAAGDVKHAHSIDGGQWEVSDVGSGATGSPATIAVDAEGVHHVAWQTDEGLAYATNAAGDFAEEELPASTAEGVDPRVGVGAEGTVYLAFRDDGDTEVQLAIRGEDEPLLAVPSPEDTGGGGAPPTGPPPCEPEGTELTIAAQNLAFDTDCLAAPAGEAFTIEFDNQDAGVPHNVAIYTDQSASPPALFQEPPFPGPESVTYEPEPIEEGGNLYFQCDVHPNMNGTFVVAAGGGGGGGGE